MLERYHLGTLTKEEHSQLIGQLIKGEHGLQVPEALAFLLEKDNTSKSYDGDHWDPILAFARIELLRYNHIVFN